MIRNEVVDRIFENVNNYFVDQISKHDALLYPPLTYEEVELVLNRIKERIEDQKAQYRMMWISEVIKESTPKDHGFIQ